MWESERTLLVVVVGALFFIFGAPVIVFFWMTSVPGPSFTGPLPPLTKDQADLAQSLRADVIKLASKPHNVRHPRALEDAANHIEQSLTASGYDVHRQEFKVDGVVVRNIEATLEPRSSQAQTLIVGAHYDSAGDALGANDNGSGSAAILALARRLAPLQGKASTRVRFVLFVNEEPPFFQTPQMGSLVYAKSLRLRGEKIRGMISLETIGYYSDRPGSQHYPPPLGVRYPTTGNFVAFVGLLSSRTFVRETVSAFRTSADFPSVGGVAPEFVQGIGWSDHWSFAQEGFPALMITDTAPFRYPYYHTDEDTSDKIDYLRLARVVTGLEKMLISWIS